MANLLVLIESRERRPLPASLEVLGRARAIASELGATVYALVWGAPLDEVHQWDLCTELSRAGADKILVAHHSTYDAPLRFGSHGPLIEATCETLTPALICAAATCGTRDVAARLAAHLGAALVCQAWLEIVDARLVLAEGDSEGRRQLEGDLDFPRVALVPAGRYRPVQLGERAKAEVQKLEFIPPIEGDLIPERAHT